MILLCVLCSKLQYHMLNLNVCRGQTSLVVNLLETKVKTKYCKEDAKGVCLRVIHSVISR